MIQDVTLRQQRNVEWATLSQAELHDICDFWLELTEEDPGYVEPERLRWHYEPEFEIAKLGPAQEWAEWYEEERRMWFEDYGDYGRYPGLEEWWQREPEEEPIVVVRGQDCKFYPWDGAHRTGISAKYGLTHVPAFVGYIQ
jgi:hypothetical protein